MKGFDYFYYAVSFVFGVIFCMVVYSIIYSLGASELELVLIVALIALVLGCGVAYAMGARRSSELRKIAYYEGVDKGMRLGRDERQSETPQFLED